MLKDIKQEPNIEIKDENVNELDLNNVESTEYGSLNLKPLSNIDPVQCETDINYEFNLDAQRLSERASQRRPRRMSVDEQARLDTVTRFSSWLEELQREAAFSVDVSDQHIVRQAMNKAQVFSNIKF